MPASTPPDWPEDVVARYETPVGGNVDLTADDECVRLRCSGCGFGNGHAYYPPAARRIAEKHAAKCRRVPRPTA